MYWVLFICPVLSLVGFTFAVDVVSLGIQVPLGTAGCIQAWQYADIARNAVDIVSSQAWWRAIAPPNGPMLALEFLNAETSYSAWESSHAFATDSSPQCSIAMESPCRVFRAAVIGPLGTQSAQLTGLASRALQIPWLLYGAPGEGLTPSPYGQLPYPNASAPVLRLCHTVGQAVEAIYSALRQIGWKRASVERTLLR